MRAIRTRPYLDSAVSGGRVDEVSSGGERIDGVVVRSDRFEALEVGHAPDLEGLVPGARVDEPGPGGEAGYGVGMLDPKLAVVSPRLDVVALLQAVAQVVLSSWEGGGELEHVLGVPAELPDADAGVLVGREDVAADGDEGLDGAGAGAEAGDEAEVGLLPDGDVVAG